MKTEEEEKEFENGMIEAIIPFLPKRKPKMPIVINTDKEMNTYCRMLAKEGDILKINKNVKISFKALLRLPNDISGKIMRNEFELF